MITDEQITEWLHEIEARPDSTPLVFRLIADRLRELTAQNEALLAENIELRSGRKVEAYESQIASLEYQLDLLKRQLGGEIISTAAAPATDAFNLLIYNSLGQILRVEKPTLEEMGGSIPGGIHFREGSTLGESSPHLLATRSLEELLFVFDSGRAVTLPVAGIPVSNAGSLDWEQAFLQEPHGSEELVFILPIARMSLFDYCIQVSRRGCIKKMRESNLETYVTSGYIGTGIKLKSDRSCSLALCHKPSRLVIVSREGYLMGLGLDPLPYTIEEAIRLGPVDHVVAAFGVSDETLLVCITQNGKVLQRETGWIESVDSLGGRGQSILSSSRREAGVRIVGAGAVDEQSWGIALCSDGQIVASRASEWVDRGAILGGEAQGVEILDFTISKG